MAFGYLVEMGTGLYQIRDHDRPATSFFVARIPVVGMTRSPSLRRLIQQHIHSGHERPIGACRAADVDGPDASGFQLCSVKGDVAGRGVELNVHISASICQLSQALGIEAEAGVNQRSISVTGIVINVGPVLKEDVDSLPCGHGISTNRLSGDGRDETNTGSGHRRTTRETVACRQAPGHQSGSRHPG